MRVKIGLLLVAAALITGLPEPEPEPDTSVDLKVDSGDAKADSYFKVVKGKTGTNVKIDTHIFGKSMGHECCLVDGIKYENGATDVPCGGELKGTLGKCVDGNVQCIEKMNVTLTIMEFNTVNSTTVKDIKPFKSFYEFMVMARSDGDFTFTSKDYGGELGQSIESINGVLGHSISNTSGNYWRFYECESKAVIADYPKGCEYTPKGVSNTFPGDNSFWLWRYEFSTWNATSHS